MKEAMIRDIAKRHPELVQDLLRITAIQVAIHVMLCAEGSEVFGNHNTVALLLYTCLGILFYHLIAKVVFEDEPKKVIVKKSEVVDP